MVKKLFRSSFVVFVTIYALVQIYLNLTVAVFAPISDIPAGTPIEASMLVEKREFKANLDPLTIQDLYYFNGKEAFIDLKVGLPLTTNVLVNTTVDATASGETDEKMKDFAIIHIPLTPGQYFSGIKTNDIVKLSYTITPSDNGTTGPVFQSLYGVQALIKSTSSMDGTTVSGIDVLIPKAVANELVMLNKIGELTVIKVFTDETEGNSVINAVDLITKLMMGY